MKIKAMALLAIFVVLGFVGVAMAGFQTVSYSAPNFSATFNGPVSADAVVTHPTNNDHTYESQNGDVIQGVTVRFIDHDIPVTQESADYYADNDLTGGDVTNRSTDTWQGHVFTYTRRHYTFNGVELSKRTRFIVVNSREVIFIEQIAPFTEGAFGTGDQPQWIEFEDTLNIK